MNNLKEEPKDRLYKLRQARAPECYLLQVEDNRRRRLLYYDEEKRINRALRYSANQASPFKDEQDTNAIREDIEFIDGFLRVPKTNPSLQYFLSLTPDRTKVFKEVDKEKDAEDELRDMDLIDHAKDRAREICEDVESLDMVYRLLFAKDTSLITTNELRRDVRVYAKRHPQKFLNLIEDTSKDLKSKVQAFFDSGILQLRNSDKEVYYNLPDSKRRMMVLVPGNNPQEQVVAWLQSKDGIEVLKILDKHLST